MYSLKARRREQVKPGLATRSQSFGLFGFRNKSGDMISNPLSKSEF